jgi:predicted phage-related endonuclease
MIDHDIRKLGIGGSDVAALFGEDEFKDAFAVWADKKGGLEREPPNDHMIVGKVLEPAILELYRHMNPDREVAYCDTTYQHPIRQFQVYSPDALVIGQRLGVEIKAALLDRGEWGWEPEQMPARVLFQCWWYCSAMDYPKWDVCALLGAGLPRIYTVERLEPALELVMLNRAEEFWKRYIVGDERPPLGDSDEAARWLRKTYPSHKRPDMREATPEEAELLNEYVVFSSAMRKLAKGRDALEIKIIDAIRDKEGLTWDGNLFTWRKTKDRSQVDWHSMAITLLHNFVNDEQERQSIEEAHTYKKEGYRRIYTNHPALKRAKGNGVEPEAEEVTA